MPLHGPAEPQPTSKPTPTQKPFSELSAEENRTSALQRLQLFVSPQVGNADARTLEPKTILSLQRIIGNRATIRILQRMKDEDTDQGLRVKITAKGSDKGRVGTLVRRIAKEQPILYVIEFDDGAEGGYNASDFEPAEDVDEENRELDEGGKGEDENEVVDDEEESQADTVYSITLRGHHVPQDDRFEDDPNWEKNEDASERNFPTNRQYFFIGEGLAYTFHASTCTALAIYSPTTGLSYLKHADASTHAPSIAAELIDYFTEVSQRLKIAKSEVSAVEEVEVTIYLGHILKNDEDQSTMRIKSSIMKYLDHAKLEGEEREGFLNRVQFEKLSTNASYVVVGEHQPPGTMDADHEYADVEAVLARIVNGEEKDDLGDDIEALLTRYARKKKHFAAIVEAIPVDYWQQAMEAAKRDGKAKLVTALQPYLDAISVTADKSN